MAAKLGLPYAFAPHLAPAQMMSAIQVYRSRFRPSEYLDRSRLMLGLGESSNLPQKMTFGLAALAYKNPAVVSALPVKRVPEMKGESAGPLGRGLCLC